MHRFVLVSLIVVAMGCGQQEFNERLEKGLVSVKYSSKFAALDLAPSTLPDTPVSFRLPTELVTRLLPTAQNPTGEGTIPAERIQPPGVALPNLRVICQGVVQDERGIPVPYFCHIAAQPQGSSPDGPTADKLLDEVTKTYQPKEEGGKIEWEDIDCDKPTMGQTIKWRRLEAKGEQNFQALNLTSPQQIPGAIQVYLYEGDGWEVIMFWRVPDTLATRVPYADLAMRCCGTLEIKQP